MKNLFDQVSIDCSKEVTRKYSTSFSLAVKMLSPKIQDSIYSIYGFVRFADEIVDSFHEYNMTELLTEFEQDLDKALERKISLNPILNAFQHVVHNYGITREMINAFLTSMRSDLHQADYSNTEDYNQYIYGSADVVGLMCLKVFVNGDDAQYERLKPSAMRLGSAFQKVNFLRDLKEDTDTLNRSYFPNINTNQLNFETKEEIIKEIEDDFAKAYVGVKLLPVEAKFGVYTAYIYYKQLLLKLKRTNAEEIKSTRIRVSNPVKIGLLAKSFLSYKLNML